ncbi:MAG: hypothetical protein LBQ55_10830 [Treponema sp.]|jgi:hypothetical protein|nr:hypothetical protein [Treponema sp.]
MKRINARIGGIVIALALALTACEGPTGPAGAQGPVGPVGGSAQVWDSSSPPQFLGYAVDAIGAISGVMVITTTGHMVWYSFDGTFGRSTIYFSGTSQSNDPLASYEPARYYPKRVFYNPHSSTDNFYVYASGGGTNTGYNSYYGEDGSANAATSASDTYYKLERVTTDRTTTLGIPAAVTGPLTFEFGE